MNKSNESMDMTQQRGTAAEQSLNESGNTQGTAHTGNPPAKPGNHQEGQYDKQDDDATMHPSNDEENAGKP